MNQGTPRFSVIIPSFNRAALLRRTLDSVFAQTLTDYQVIVVDDGSTDDSLEVLRSYGSQLRVATQTNQGPGVARNHGLKLARGQYVAFLDSDDLWFPWTLDTYARIIEQTKQPAWLVSDPLRFTHESDLQNVQQGTLEYEQHADYFSATRHPYMVSGSALVVQRELALRVGGFAEHRLNAEDSDFYMRLGIAAGFVHVKQPVTFAYREHANSLIALSQRTLQGVEYLLQQEVRGQYPGGRTRRWQRRKILSYHLRPVMLSALAHGQRQAAWKMYQRTFAWHLRLNRYKFLAGFMARLVMSKAS